VNRPTQLLRAVGVQLVGRVLGTLASIFTVAITTRYLGVNQYGLLTTAVVFIGLWNSFTELGVGAVIVRKVTSGSGDLSTLLGTNIGLSIGYCIPLAVLAGFSGFGVYYGEPRLHPLILIVACGLALSSVSSCLQPVFLVSIRFNAVALSDVLCRFATLATTGIVVSTGGGLVWIGVVQIVPPFVQLLVFGYAARRIVAIRPTFAWRPSLDLLRESLPQTAVGIISMLYWRADGLILTLLSNARQVAAYGVAYTIAFNFSVVSGFYLASSLSTMTEKYARDRGEFARFIESSVELMLFMGLPVVTYGALLAGPIIRLIGSADFASIGATPLSLLLGAVALTFLTGVLSQALFAAHEQRFLLRLNIVNLAGNIALNIILAPHFGATGAGIALIASELSGAAVSVWRLVRVCPYRMPYQFFVRLLLPLGCGLIALLLLHGEFVLLPLVAGAIVYAGVNLLAGPVRISTIRAVLGRGDPVEAAP